MESDQPYHQHFSSTTYLCSARPNENAALRAWRLSRLHCGPSLHCCQGTALKNSGQAFLQPCISKVFFVEAGSVKLAMHLCSLLPGTLIYCCNGVLSGVLTGVLLPSLIHICAGVPTSAGGKHSISCGWLPGRRSECATTTMALQLLTAMPCPQQQTQRSAGRHQSLCQGWHFLSGLCLTVGFLKPVPAQLQNRLCLEVMQQKHVISQAAGAPGSLDMFLHSRDRCPRAGYLPQSGINWGEYHHA